MHRVIGVFVLAILELIDIIKGPMIQTHLVKQGLRTVTALDIRSHTTGSTHTHIQQEAKGTIRLTSLQLILETQSSGYTQTAGIITLGRNQRPFAYLGKASNEMAHFRTHITAKQQREQKNSI